MSPRAPWREALALILWLLSTIGMRPLLLPDEGRYAGVALEMLNGSALVPTLDGLPFFHKPPLLYWLDMAAMSVFGVDVFAVRVGPLLLAWLLGMALFVHLRRWHGDVVARLGLVVLATTPLYFVGAQYVNHDVGVAACITAAVLAMVRAVDESPRLSRRWLLAGWAFCGLGMLAKGLIGVVLPLLVVLPWLLAQRRWRDARALLHPLGLLTFAAIVVPWMFEMQRRFPGFFDYFIVEQHFRRFAGTHFNNREPFWFFVFVLPLLMLPWSLWLWPALRQRGQRGPHAGLYLWWLAAVVSFFSLPTSKLVGYVMPALAPAAALLALALQARALRWRWLAGVAAALCTAIIVALAWQAHGSHRDVGLALGARVQAGDRVIFVDHYFFDLPFYAGLRAPVPVVSDWDDPDLSNHDNWRKELWDAARFAPDRGASVLWPWSHLAALPCASGSTWIVTTHEDLPRLHAMLRITPVFEGRHALLVQAEALACGAPAVRP